MIHRILTCKNHPELRWSSKEIAVGGDKPGDAARYNGARSLHFIGKTTGQMFEDRSGVACMLAEECQCSIHDLVIAPEDALVRRDR